MSQSQIFSDSTVPTSSHLRRKINRVGRMNDEGSLVLVVVDRQYTIMDTLFVTRTVPKRRLSFIWVSEILKGCRN